LLWQVAQNHFVVKHYAGDVLYRTDGLLDKSQDALHPDLEKLQAAGAAGDDFLPRLAAARRTGPLRDQVSDARSVGTLHPLRALSTTTTHHLGMN
jgi:myosin heavy subunit